MAVVRADVEAAAGGCDRALDRAADVLRATAAAVVGVERPHVAVPVADVEPVADQQRRALGRADRVLPVDLPVARGERDDASVVPVAAARDVARRPVEEHGVHRAVRVRPDRRRRGDAAVQVELPRTLAGLHADRGEAPGVRGEVEPPVADRRRELDEAARAVSSRRRGTAAAARAATERVRVASKPYIGHGTFAAAGGGFGGVVGGVNSAVDEPRTSFACCTRWITSAASTPRDEHGEHCEDDEEAPHGGVTLALGCNDSEIDCASSAPAEFVAESVACQVPAGMATSCAAA